MSYHYNKTKPSHWVETRLREGIINGIYPPNTFLPPQRKLAEQFGVQRRVVRIALEKLKDSGLVESNRGRGTRVLPRMERVNRCRIAYIHSPIKSWTGLEPHHIRDGILRRVQQLDCDCTEVSIYNESIPAVRGETSRMIKLDELPELINEFSAFIFHEASLTVADYILELQKKNIPVVVANLEIKLDVSATLVDHERIMMQAVETLASFGHKRIAYIGTSPEFVFYGRALNGFKKGMELLNLEIDDSLIVFCEHSNPIDAYKAAQTLLRNENLPTAIVAARDVIAEGTCRAIREAGMDVGHDISVIGFDDVSWNGPAPFLTTFYEPCNEMGALAVDMLIERIDNPELPVEQRVLDAPLLLRCSVGLPQK